ncbi:putative General secretion pathway protein F [Desulfamplus magnetovallimortis]|uniref:Putative General secretion pathway protein F n=1 Tax=Desulfamplus magnetovallimortis TaxID=1246637 RepID=A0A1W1HD30_9BACT|nr:type II secretion system F family protein [Desulfamplus magnetovallimortis]SLM30380.1 putative General secretion pathway protein F [Desulfamplus magnetovallimortis]
MPQFRFEYINAQGKKGIETLDARDKAEVLMILQARSSTLIRWLDNTSLPLFSTLFRNPSNKPKTLNNPRLLKLTSDLAHLFRSGLPVDRALAIAGSATADVKIKSMTAYLQNALKKGTNLSDAMADRPEDFNDLYVNMVRVGEMGGILPSVMERLSEFIERSEEIKKYVISSSIYPAILLSVGMLSLVVILGFVVPKFAGIFADLGQEIPFSTLVLLELSQFITKWWWLVLSLAILFSLFLWRFMKTPGGRALYDKNILRFPYVGEVLLDIEMSRFSRTLGTLVQSGVPLMKALHIVRAVVSNSRVKEAVTHIYNQVREGRSVSALMRERDVFPPMVVQMVSLGEETGKTGEMLVSVAEDLDRKIQSKIKTYLALLEPFSILFLGLLIGGVVVSMLSTIFGINEIQF